MTIDTSTRADAGGHDADDAANAKRHPGRCPAPQPRAQAGELGRQPETRPQGRQPTAPAPLVRQSSDAIVSTMAIGQPTGSAAPPFGRSPDRQAAAPTEHRTRHAHSSPSSTHGPRRAEADTPQLASRLPRCDQVSDGRAWDPGLLGRRGYAAVAPYAATLYAAALRVSSGARLASGRIEMAPTPPRGARGVWAPGTAETSIRMTTR
jgi:hypothetical protein